MNDTGIFVFGLTLFEEKKLDAVSSLPLELSWKIFTYVDDGSLHNAVKVSLLWRRIIISNMALRKRLNIFEAALMLGSKSLVKYSGKGRRNSKKKMSKNYLSIGEYPVQSTITVLKCKRGGDDLIICSKRFKLH
ncbi:unnamed protein product [Parnassius mnemosyne]|uniref:F-box domain-containing protein n=1 Tax=Parnassius mnemosyne TaxID=213953 RepID=A0AAV1KHD4_9NEOP